MSTTTELSAKDAELLSRDLPQLSLARLAGTGDHVIEYREAGPVDAPALVLLHGIGSSSAGYRAQLADLSDRYRVVAWNAPGYGGSTPLPPDPTARAYAEALAALLDALDVSRVAVLVGSSWGSVIALNFAANAPTRVSALVLSAPNTAQGKLTGAAREAELAARRRAGRPDSGADRGAVADRLLTPDTPPAVRALVERLRDALTPEGWDAAVHMTFTTDTPSVIAGLRIPIALLVGTRDKVAPLEMHAAKLMEAKPDAILHVWEGYGHMLKLEAPSRFNEILREMAEAGLPSG